MSFTSDPMCGPTIDLPHEGYIGIAGRDVWDADVSGRLAEPPIYPVRQSLRCMGAFR